MLRPKGGSEVCSVLKESFQESCKRNRGNLGNGICSMCGIERKMDEEDFRDILLYIMSGILFGNILRNLKI